MTNIDRRGFFGAFASALVAFKAAPTVVKKLDFSGFIPRRRSGNVIFTDKVFAALLKADMKKSLVKIGA